MQLRMPPLQIRGWAVAALTFALVRSPSHAQIPTTLPDFFQKGTQPDTSGGENFDPIRSAANCRNCHEVYDPVEYPIYSRWAGTMKANSARDPLFQACLAVANQDAAFAGDTCLRCHAPGGWLEGRSLPTDGSALIERDFEGVTCSVCHRMVDPVFKSGISPPADQAILNALSAAGLLPLNPGSGNFVIDPSDSRRGPFDDVPLNLHDPAPMYYSPFHSTSQLCATCHEVSNPILSRQANGTYMPNALNTPHETSNQYEMFPLERTYSEWLNSTYANGGVDAGGVFGGNHPTGVMSSCQDCHMPDADAYGSAFDHEPFFQRPDIPSHDFAGGNTWVQDLIKNLYPGEVEPWYLDDSKDRARSMLQRASTLQVSPEACHVNVRVINETGHKLPTGFSEGRRMWITVEFMNEDLDPIVVRGKYETSSAGLSTEDTKVYEAELGIDPAMAALSGKPEGPSFHFAINNKYFKDNRIPPRGFTNAAFASAQAAPVGYAYADGQYRDDTRYWVPPGATRAVVSVYYQTASKEYITFLRDENHTNDAGDILYEQWELTGKSPPVLMRQASISGLTAGIFADADCDLDVDLNDWALLGDCVNGPGASLRLGCESLDAGMNSIVDLRDFAGLQRAFSGE